MLHPLCKCALRTVAGRSLPRCLPVLLAVVTLWPGALAAQDMDPLELADRLRTGLAEAEIQGDTAALGQMVTLARRAVTAFPDDALLHHYAGYGIYRLAIRRMADGSTVDDLLTEAESSLRASIETRPLAESYAILSSLLGMRVDDPATAMRLGMQSVEAILRARALGPDNPRVRLLEGISAFHMPETYGGGHRAALEHFLAALELFANDAPPVPLPDWGHAEAWAWLGQTHSALGQTEEARAAFERALEVQPDYAWVRDILLPTAGGSSR